MLFAFFTGCLPNSPKSALKLAIPLISETATVTSSTTVTPSTTTTPAISVTVNNVSFANGSTYDFGTLSIHSASTALSIQISNTGTGSLTLSGSPIISNSGTNSSDFSITTTNLNSEISAGGSSSFSVVFTASANGSRTTTLTIASNDTSTPSFTIVLTGTGSIQPSMAVSYSGTDLANGATLSFGNVLTGQSSSVATITITNSGTQDLTITGGTAGITKSGTNNADFALDTTGTQSIITSGGGTTTFTLTFSPTTTGAYSVTLSIPNDDPNKNPFTLVLTGTGTAPEINVKINGTSIASGGTYDFGSIYSGSSSSAIPVVIENTGTGNLSISAFGISGGNASNFTITGSVSSPVASSSTTGFNLTFSPNAVQTFTTTLSITNTDSNEGTYTITLNGTGTTAPNINLKIAGTTYASGSMYYFGNYQTSTNNSITFTIENTGGSTLSVTSITGSTTSFVYSTLNTTIAGSSNTTFSVNFTPQSAGLLSTTLTIASDDPDTSSYTVTLKGTGLNDATADCGAVGSNGDKVILLSTSTYDGNLGGKSGADTKCQSDATVTAYNSSSYKAFIGTSTSRTVTGTDWVLYADTRYFNSSGNCIFRTDGSKKPGSFFAPIGTSSDKVFTGLKSDYTGGTDRCGSTSWTSNSTNDNGIFGIANATDSTAIYNVSPGGQYKCSQAKKLYCVEQ